MISVTFEHKNKDFSFDIDPVLIGTANEALAKAIMDSVDKKNGDFAHLFDAEKYDTYSWDLCDDESLSLLMKASLKAEASAREDGDIENYKGYLSDEIDRVLETVGHSFDASIAYDNAFWDNHSGLDDDIVEALSQLEGVDPDIEDGDFANLLRYAACDIMAENDKSEATDLISHHVKAEFTFSKGIDWNTEYAEDCHTDHESVCSAVDTVVACEKLQPLFDMANLAPKAFIDHLISNEIGNKDEIVERYSSLKDNSDSTKPVILSAENMVHVLDNATYGGVPMFTAYVNVSEFVNRDITKGFYLDDGVLGLEDVINGSGHNEGIEKGSKIFISAEETCGIRFFTGNSMRDCVYGYYRPALTANLSQDEDSELKNAA